MLRAGLDANLNQDTGKVSSPELKSRTTAVQPEMDISLLLGQVSRCKDTRLCLASNGSPQMCFLMSGVSGRASFFVMVRRFVQGERKIHTNAALPQKCHEPSGPLSWLLHLHHSHWLWTRCQDGTRYLPLCILSCFGCFFPWLGKNARFCSRHQTSPATSSFFTFKREAGFRPSRICGSSLLSHSPGRLVPKLDSSLRKSSESRRKYDLG